MSVGVGAGGGRSFGQQVGGRKVSVGPCWSVVDLLLRLAGQPALREAVFRPAWAQEVEADQEAEAHELQQCPCHLHAGLPPIVTATVKRGGGCVESVTGVCQRPMGPSGPPRQHPNARA